ncbi:MAG: CerR family C-terminal domain-containing protein [Aquamicrobium sp.]|uniref:CerR family C-terminal domain-containing protein n=1 Tax=Aquamicrobium sp. TaxID=1872579 RepID=UPI00349EB7D5|nr:CerR family C-terminal domain-containing protein [Aquamicrobium sp.]
MSEDNDTDAAGRSSAEKTRAALIEAGLRLFGEKGFAATSTREIAAEAKANIGSIAYHFGGKGELRDACAAHIVETIARVADPVLATMPPPTDRAAAEAQLRIATERMAGFLVAAPEMSSFVQFILREIHHPGRAFDILYAGLVEKVHRRLCAVWAVASGDDAESEATKIAVFTMIGQTVYFRIAREAVLRRMGWREIGATEAGLITATVLENALAALAAHRERKP